MAVSKRLRYEVLRRDNHTCRYCGATAPGVKLTIDHVTPSALGGADTAGNLVTACSACNSGKTSTSPNAQHVADVSDDALRWTNAMKQAVDKLAIQEQVKLDYRTAFRAEWDRWGIGEGEKRKPVDLPGDWKPSIENFRLASLPAWAWADIVDDAMGRDLVKPENKFKYCCGIAWNKVTELQEEARRHVSEKGAGGCDRPVSDVDNSRLTQGYLYAVWRWAWKRTESAAPVKSDEADFMQDLIELWDRGLSSRIDLTEMVFLAGSDLATDPSSYLPEELMTVEQRNRRLPLTDEQYATGSGVLNVWASFWEDADPDGGPTGRQEQSFLASLTPLLRASCERDDLLNAAKSAGTSLSTDLASYLPVPLRPLS